MAGQEVTRGRGLKAARIKAGLGQDEASKALGIHRVTLSRIERGLQKKVSAELHRKMADLYQLPNDATVDSESFAPNPALKQRLRPKPYARVYEHTERMVAAGCSVEQIEEAERLMIDGAYNKLNARDPRERSDEEMILDIDDAWDWIKDVLGRLGVKALG